MTAITLNLLAEEQRALEARARDPFKVTLIVGVLAVTLTIVIGFMLSFVANKYRIQASQLRAEIEALGESAVAEAEIRYRWTESLSQDVVTINRQRFLFADKLAAIKDLAPSTIQLTTLDLSVQTITKQLEPVLPTGSTAEPASTKPRRPQKTELLVLRFEGRATGARPELEVDEFLHRVREGNQFSGVLEDIQLQSIARAGLTDPSGAAPKAPSAFFVIECTLRGQP